MDQTFTAGFGFVAPEHDDEWGTYKGRDDGEDAKAPAPADTVKSNDMLDRVAVDPGSDQPGRCSVRNEEASVLELGGIGDEDNHGEVDAVVARVEEGVGCAVRFDVVAACH